MDSRCKLNYWTKESELLNAGFSGWACFTNNYQKNCNIKNERTRLGFQWSIILYNSLLLLKNSTKTPKKSLTLWLTKIKINTRGSTSTGNGSFLEKKISGWPETFPVDRKRFRSTGNDRKLRFWEKNFRLTGNVSGRPERPEIFPVGRKDRKFFTVKIKKISRR